MSLSFIFLRVYSIICIDGLPYYFHLSLLYHLSPIFPCPPLRAFSVVETVEAVAAMKTTVSTRLSVQEVIDCSQGYEGGLWGCKGGDTRLALKWLKDVRSVRVLIHKYIQYQIL